MLFSICKQEFKMTFKEISLLTDAIKKWTYSIKSYLKAIRFIQIKMSCSTRIMTVHNNYGCVFAYISTITSYINTLICYYTMVIN